MGDTGGKKALDAARESRRTGRRHADCEGGSLSLGNGNPLQSKVVSSPFLPPFCPLRPLPPPALPRR